MGKTLNVTTEMFQSLPRIFRLTWVTATLLVGNALAQTSPMLVGEIEFTQAMRPAYVDNKARATLDDISLRLHREPASRLIIVGFGSSAGHHAAKYDSDLPKLSAINLKTYLVGETGVSASRIEVRSARAGMHGASIYLVPPESLVDSVPGISFDESSIRLPTCVEDYEKAVEMHFEPLQAILNQEDKQSLTESATVLREQQDEFVVIVGTATSDMGLAATRAMSIKRYLLSQGHVPSKQIVVRIKNEAGDVTKLLLLSKHDDYSCFGQELDSENIDKPFLSSIPGCPALVAYLYPSDMTLRGWDSPSGDITVIVGVPGDLHFEQELHDIGLRQYIGKACTSDRPIGSLGARLGLLRVERPYALRVSLVRDGFKLVGEPSSQMDSPQQFSKEHFIKWGWKIAPNKSAPTVRVSFDGASKDYYEPVINVSPNWTWYLARFWGWILAAAGAAGAVAKGKDLVDWLRSKHMGHKTGGGS